MENKEVLIKSESNGSINFPFVPSATLAWCIEGANGKHSPRTDLISAYLIFVNIIILLQIYRRVVEW
jgi:hypothetical protein